jgi:uncharacterized membrane-anchored protein
MTRPIRVAAVATLQVVVLLGMIANKQWTILTGTPVVLATRAVDPRSLFMGDYARLSYDIGSLKLEGDGAIRGDRGFGRRDTVWVALRPDPAGAVAVSAHHDRRDVPPGLLALRGEVVAEVGPSGQDTLLVRYGIEQYFVPEGTGMQIERPQAGETLAIRVAIDQRGQAAILAVLFDGQERYRETLF